MHSWTVSKQLLNMLVLAVIAVIVLTGVIGYADDVAQGFIRALRQMLKLCEQYAYARDYDVVFNAIVSLNVHVLYSEPHGGQSY